MKEETKQRLLREAPLRMLATRIRRARKTKGLTLDQLADTVGTSRQHLIRLERGEHRPRQGMLEQIAKATEHDYAWFCLAELDPSPFQEAAA